MASAQSRKVNDHRALFGYTGTYQGVPVSVQTTGMGTPSFSIVVEELLRLGATRLIRVGTCGGIGRGIHTGDLVIATAAAPVDGSTRTYLHGDPFAPVADFGLTRALVDAATAAGVTPFVGPVATVDVFYNPDADYVSKWRGRGILGFEMEAAALFYLAGREQGVGQGRARRVRPDRVRHAVRGGDLRGHLHEPRGPGAGDRPHDPGRPRGRVGVHPMTGAEGRASGLAIPVGVNLTTHRGHRALVAGHGAAGRGRGLLDGLGLGPLRELGPPGRSAAGVLDDAGGRGRDHVARPPGQLRDQRREPTPGGPRAPGHDRR